MKTYIHQKSVRRLFEYFFKIALILFTSTTLYGQKKVFQFGHFGNITSIALSDDRLTAATGGKDGRVIVWDINRRDVTHSFSTNGNAISDISFHPNKELIAAVDGEGSIFIWSLKSSSLEKRFVENSYGPVIFENLKSQDTNYYDVTPNKINYGGGKILFIENSLLVGVSIPTTAMQSSLFNINLDTNEIKAVNNIPRYSGGSFMTVEGILSLKNNQILIHFKTNKGAYVFDLETEKINDYLLKNSDIENFSINDARNKIAFSLGSRYKNDDYITETKIYHTDKKEIIDIIPYNGYLSWDLNTLWIGYLDNLYSYNLDAKSIENSLKLNYTIDQLFCVHEQSKLMLLNQSTGVELIEPLQISQIRKTQIGNGKRKRGSKTGNVFFVKFLNEDEILLQHEDYRDRKEDEDVEIYLWNIKRDNVTPLFKYGNSKRSIRITHVDKKNNLIYGYNLDSTKTKYEDYLGETEYKDLYTFDVFKRTKNGFSLLNLPTSLNQQISNSNSDLDNDLYFYNRFKKKKLVVKKSNKKDTLYVLPDHNENRPIKNIFFDQMSQNIALLSYSGNEKRIRFYNKNKGLEKPFYEYSTDRFEILAFDGKKRLLIREYWDKYLIINLANPQSKVEIDIRTGFGSPVRFKRGAFHPTEPWLFINGEDRELLCYDYSLKKIIGGYQFDIENNLKYSKSIDKIKTNSDGSKLVVKFDNNELVVLEVNGTSNNYSLTKNSNLISDFNQTGSYLILNSTVINLVSLKKEILFDDYYKTTTSVEENYFTHYSIQENRNERDEEVTYLYVNKQNKQNAQKQIDSFNLQSTSISHYDKPHKLINNRYLISVTKNYGNFINPKIFDLKTKKILIELGGSGQNKDTRIFDDFLVEKDYLYFYNFSKFYGWKIGSEEISELDIETDYYNLWPNLVAPTISCVKLDNKVIKSEYNYIYEYDLEKRIKIDSTIIPAKFSRVMLMKKLNDEKIWTTVYSKADEAFGLSFFNPNTNTWSEVVKLSSRPLKIDISDNKQFLMVSLYSGGFELRKTDTGQLITTFYKQANGDFFAIDENGFYSSSNSNIMPFKTNVDGEIYYDRYLDLVDNRPDIILKNIGLIDDNDLKLYQRAASLRQNYYNYSNSKDFSEISDLKFYNKKEKFITTESNVNFKFLFPSDSLTIVPVVNGQNLYDKTLVKDYNNQIDIPLTFGENHIQVFSKKTEQQNLAKEIKVTSKKRSENTNLIICAISVSDYENSDYDLNYAVKDAKDLISAFKTQKSEYDSIKTFELYDKDVTLGKLSTLFDSIKPNINDKVIFFLSGHGLLGKEKDFYFATHNIDFEKPEINGLNFSQLQQWISEVPSQKKLLLIDTCHSGLVDLSSSPKQVEIVESESNQSVELKTNFKNNVISKGNIAKSLENKKVSKQSAFDLMRTIFSSINSTSGVETITAASGDSWALESDKWQNGSFTFAVKQALLEYKADSNQNGIITIEELKEYIFSEVPKLTNGKQQPTSRATNKYLNWNLWY